MSDSVISHSFNMLLEIQILSARFLFIYLKSLISNVGFVGKCWNFERYYVDSDWRYSSIYFRRKLCFHSQDHHQIWGHPRGVVVNILDCSIIVSEFKLQSHSSVHFRTNILRKDLPQLFFSKDGLKYWYAIKETKPSYVNLLVWFYLIFSFNLVRLFFSFDSI